MNSFKQKSFAAIIVIALCIFAFATQINKSATAGEPVARIVDGVEIKTTRAEFAQVQTAAQIHDIIADQQLQNLQITVNVDGTIKKVEDWDGSMPESNGSVFQGFVAKDKNGAIVLRDSSNKLSPEETDQMPYVESKNDGLTIPVSPLMGINVHDNCDQDNNYPCWWDSHYKNQIVTFVGEGNYNINIEYRGDFYSRGCPVDVIKWEWPVDSIDRSVATYTNLPANNKILMNDVIKGDKDQINVLGTRVSYSHC